MRRGEVHWCLLPPPANRRPVLVLTRDSAIGYLRGITVAEITTTVRGAPGEVILDQNDGLPDVCAVNLYNLHTVRKSALHERMATLSEGKLRQVEEALCWALGMDRLLTD
jgi:mRNA interferase MazF